MLRGAPISGSRVIALLFAAQALACGSDGEPSAQAGTDSSGGSGGGDARVPDDVAAMPDADASGDDAPFDAGADDGAGFESLFNGLDLDGWQLVGVDTSTLSVENGAIKCTGQPQGYFYPAGTYRNFVWRVDFRFAPSVPIDANSGYFVYITGPHQIWPSALEVQGRNTDFGDVFQLPGLEPLNDNLDVAAMNAARRPLGEWNQIEITSNEGTLSVRLNGTLINVSPPVSTFREGQIALESEGAEIYFRNVVIKRLP